MTEQPTSPDTSQGFTFSVEPRLFEVLPDACFGLLLATGIDNTVAGQAIDELLEAAVSQRAGELQGVKVKESEVVAPYREAFRALGTNPNKFMCSIEALLTRIGKGGGVPHINPVVDLGNAVSLRHQVPLGAHDVGTTDGELAVRYSRPDDGFAPFGGTEPEPVDEGELVYAAGSQVRTRRWTWRQSEQGKITGATHDVLFPVDGFTGTNDEAVRAARDELAALLPEHLGCRVQVGWVDAEHHTAHFD